MKMVNETQKIMKKKIAVAATCVRVPVLRSHTESITVTFEDDVDVDINKVKEAIHNFENVEVMDDLENGVYPMPIISTDTDITYVGRIRKDIYAKNMIHMFNSADQVRVGAATNAVRIALKWIKLQEEK
jgi:aspartate-semialdehyde dehydrogenase